MPQPQYITSKSVYNPATTRTPNQNEFACPALPKTPRVSHTCVLRTSPNPQSQSRSDSVARSLEEKVLTLYTLDN